MKFLILKALTSGLKPLLQLFQASPKHNHSYRLPHLPSLEWELELRLQHNRSIRAIAKFFFSLGMAALAGALGVMLWQALPLFAI